MNKKILSIATAGLAFVPLVSFAKTLNEIVNAAKTSLTALSGGLATIAFIVAGIMFLTATGNPSRMTIAKGALIAGVVGIVIIVLANGAEAFVKTFFGL